MKTAVIVQARLGSTRLPRKVLKKINGKTLIEIIYARLSKTKFVDQIIFSIPNTKENNELEAFLRKKNFFILEEMKMMFFQDIIKQQKNLK